MVSQSIPQKLVGLDYTKLKRRKSFSMVSMDVLQTLFTCNLSEWPLSYEVHVEGNCEFWSVHELRLSPPDDEEEKAESDHS